MEHARPKSVENISRDYYSGFCRLWRTTAESRRSCQRHRERKKCSLYNLRPGQLYLWLEEISPRLSHWDHLLSVVCPFVLFDPSFLAFTLCSLQALRQMQRSLPWPAQTPQSGRDPNTASVGLAARCERKPSVWGDCVWPLTSACPQRTRLLRLPRETAHTFVCLLGFRLKLFD